MFLFIINFCKQSFQFTFLLLIVPTDVVCLCSSEYLFVCHLLPPVFLYYSSPDPYFKTFPNTYCLCSWCSMSMMHTLQWSTQNTEQISLVNSEWVNSSGSQQIANSTECYFSKSNSTFYILSSWRLSFHGITVSSYLEDSVYCGVNRFIVTHIVLWRPFHSKSHYFSFRNIYSHSSLLALSNYFVIFCKSSSLSATVAWSSAHLIMSVLCSRINIPCVPSKASLINFSL